METEIDFYKEYYDKCIKTLDKVSDILSIECKDHIEHFKTRIKSKESATAKLEKLGLDPTLENAIGNLNDIIGARIICRFLSDVFVVADLIENHTAFKHILSKDYIKSPKENGYRSYHIILEIAFEDCSIPVEIQIRTISQDSWASLEHTMKYKKQISNTSLISAELKRLSDEMASTDVCMQTLRELINISKD